MNKVELFVGSGTTMYEPVLINDVVWTTHRKSAPGQLEFTVVKDAALQLEEGNAVKFAFGGVSLFYGYVFDKGSNKDKQIKVKAYDQIRYLKNKDTYVYEHKTASQFLRMVAQDYGLRLGDIHETGFVIASRVEENKTLLDMIENALDITLTNRRIMHVLFDDAGKLTLKPLDHMRVGSLMDADTIEDYDYTSSIDKQTYNRIKLMHEDKDGGRQIYIAEDKAGTMRNWGTLQLFETLSNTENAQQKANTLLSLHNAKTRTLSIKNQLGDVRIRAGSMPVISLQLEDTKINGHMLVEKCRHVFRQGEHFMDLDLRGGEFVV